MQGSHSYFVITDERASTEPGDVELGCYAEELRELLVTIQAKTESQLERGEP